MAWLLNYRLQSRCLDASLRPLLLAPRQERQGCALAASRLCFETRGENSMVTVSAPQLFSSSAGVSGTPSLGRTVSQSPPASRSELPSERKGVGGGVLHPESADPFQPQPRRRMDLKLGPYAGGRIFVSPREDPKEFILCVIIVAIFLYTLVTTYTQPGGETVNQRRRRIIKERLMKEAGITQADLDELEAEEAPLSS